MQNEMIEKMMALTSGKKIRQRRIATKAEEYLMNFWFPTPGHTVFGDLAPGEEYVIDKLDKDYPEQATVKIKVKGKKNRTEIIYLQDWWWAPKQEELDEVLKGFGVKVYDDMLQRNQTFMGKPKTTEEYKRIIQNVRMFGYSEGTDIVETYFERMRENAAN